MVLQKLFEEYHHKETQKALWCRRRAAKMDNEEARVPKDGRRMLLQKLLEECQHKETKEMDNEEDAVTKDG